MQSPQQQKQEPLLPVEFRDLGPGELLVNEFFLSIQGESSHAGRPCFFIRLAGCHLRCEYCDTAYAFHDGRRKTVQDCIRRATESGCGLVEVTGGEPLLQRESLALLAGLCDRGLEVLLETSGAVGFDGVDPRVKKIVDVKCPSSAMEHRNTSGLAPSLAPGDELKFVIADRRDFDWARSWLEREETLLPTSIPLHFSPIHGRLSPRELSGWILEEHLPVRLNLQIHKYIWPEEERGV